MPNVRAEKKLLFYNSGYKLPGKRFTYEELKIKIRANSVNYDSRKAKRGSKSNPFLCIVDFVANTKAPTIMDRKGKVLTITHDELKGGSIQAKTVDFIPS